MDFKGPPHKNIHSCPVSFTSLQKCHFIRDSTPDVPMWNAGPISLWPLLSVAIVRTGHVYWTYHLVFYLLPLAHQMHESWWWELGPGFAHGWTPGTYNRACPGQEQVTGLKPPSALLTHGLLPDPLSRERHCPEEEECLLLHPCLYIFYFIYTF